MLSSEKEQDDEYMDSGPYTLLSAPIALILLFYFCSGKQPQIHHPFTYYEKLKTTKAWSPWYTEIPSLITSQGQEWLMDKV